jgi:uncharacterized membrane protein YoaK (UPF0700 family)
MFKHQGKSRTLKHNLHIAIVLSLVAGIVNVTGYLAIQELTTNVTGHFAQFMYDVTNVKVMEGIVYFFYIFSFFFGSFASSYLIERFSENKKLNVYLLPTIIECIILFVLALVADNFRQHHPSVIACSLLFVMGLQNSFVSKISNAVVRTTHLTGLFTDFGIALSHLFFPNRHTNQSEIKGNIRLYVSIISSFFIGGTIGGVFYSGFNLQLKTLFLPVVILTISIFYDDLRFRLIQARKLFK